MLNEARRYLLAVGIFGWEDFEKKSWPFLDNRSFEDHIAAIVLASYYLQSSERILNLIRKMGSLFPERLIRPEGVDIDLEALYRKFAADTWTVTSANTLNEEGGFAFLVNNIVKSRFNPPEKK